MNEEIFAGLRNAVERGSSVEQVAQSFINAGYNEQEVREAAAMVSQGVSIPLSKTAAENKTQQLPQLPKLSNQPIKPAEQVQPAAESSDAQTKKSPKIVLLMIILLLLLIFLGSIFLFREQLTSFIENLIS